jgi:hypothetical protein
MHRILKKKAQGVERLAFQCMLKKYGIESNTTIRSILGLYDSQTIIKLQRLVHQKFPLQYPTIFQQKSSIENVQNNAKKKEETLCRSLKRGQEEIDTFLCEKIMVMAIAKIFVLEFKLSLTKKYYPLK